MFTRPSSDELLEGCIISLQTDILPNLTNERAQVVVVMMQALLQSVRQRLPVEQQIMAAEHNQITDLFRDIVPLAKGDSGPSQRLLARAQRCGAMDDLPAIPAFDDVVERYRELSQALVDTVDDLDEMIREGEEGAEQALARVRAYLALRVATDFGTLVVGPGMAGRG